MEDLSSLLLCYPCIFYSSQFYYRCNNVLDKKEAFLLFNTAEASKQGEECSRYMKSLPLFRYIAFFTSIFELCISMIKAFDQTDKETHLLAS